MSVVDDTTNTTLDSSWKHLINITLTNQTTVKTKQTPSVSDKESISDNNQILYNFINHDIKTLQL